MTITSFSEAYRSESIKRGAWLCIAILAPMLLANVWLVFGLMLGRDFDVNQLMTIVERISYFELEAQDWGWAFAWAASSAIAAYRLYSFKRKPTISNATAASLCLSLYRQRNLNNEAIMLLRTRTIPKQSFLDDITL